VDAAARRLGLERNVAGDRSHEITENWLLPVRNVIPDEDGNVIEPVSDEEMGNICGD
jgi:hypothetical protein